LRYLFADDGNFKAGITVGAFGNLREGSIPAVFVLTN
jgi:hypothetical protein